MCQNFSATQFSFTTIHFQWCSCPVFGPVIPWFLFRFQPWVFLLELYEQEHWHPGTIIIIWEVPGNDWPQTTVHDFNIFWRNYCSINFSHFSTDAIMQPHIMTLILHRDKYIQVGMLNDNFFSKYRFDCHFQSQCGSRPKIITFFQSSNGHRCFSLHHATNIFSCLPPEFVFSSCIRTDDTPCFDE